MEVFDALLIIIPVVVVLLLCLSLIIMVLARLISVWEDWGLASYMYSYQLSDNVTASVKNVL